MTDINDLACDLNLSPTTLRIFRKEFGNDLEHAVKMINDSIFSLDNYLYKISGCGESYKNTCCSCMSVVTDEDSIYFQVSHSYKPVTISESNIDLEEMIFKMESKIDHIYDGIEKIFDKIERINNAILDIYVKIESMNGEIRGLRDNIIVRK
jgi:hypothetical protein